MPNQSFSKVPLVGYRCTSFSRADEPMAILEASACSRASSWNENMCPNNSQMARRCWGTRFGRGVMTGDQAPEFAADDDGDRHRGGHTHIAQVLKVDRRDRT